ncbi:MAG: hypothetical protein ACOY0T_05905 [Myxococcota bacterium]
MAIGRIAGVGVGGLMLSVLLEGCSATNDTDRDAVDPSYEELTLVSSEGYSQSIEGASCNPVLTLDTLVLKLPSRELSWDTCDRTSAGSAEHNVGTRTLSDSEMVPIRQAVDGVVKSDQKSCIFDLSTIMLDVRTKSGVQRLANDYYAGCPSGALKGRTFVKGLFELEQELRKAL